MNLFLQVEEWQRCIGFSNVSLLAARVVSTKYEPDKQTSLDLSVIYRVWNKNSFLSLVR
jgi:hypothetical protein